MTQYDRLLKEYLNTDILVEWIFNELPFGHCRFCICSYSSDYSCFKIGCRDGIKLYLNSEVEE